MRTINTTLDLINQRISLRKYKEQEITPEHLELILNSAMRAPTAGNMMLYSILVVKDAQTKVKLSQTCDHQPFIAKAPVILIFLADMQRWFDLYQHHGVEKFCQQQGEELRRPDKGDFLLAASDALIAAQNAVIAAESVGIGSCYIGDIMENYETHQQMFELPDYVFPVAMLCFGYYPEDTVKVAKDRFDQRFIVFEEKYRRLKATELDEIIQERAKVFVPNNKFHAENFVQWMYARKTGAEFSQEMSRSVKVALEKWSG